MVLLCIIIRQYGGDSLTLEVLLATSGRLDVHELAFHQLNDELATAEDEAVLERLQLAIVSARKRVSFEEDLRED